MLIRIGYELVFDVPARCPMMLMLDIRPERRPSVRRPGGLRVEPAVPVETFVDAFGNLCGRLVAPCGRLRLWDDLVVEDDGLADAVEPGARRLPVERLPAEVLV